MPLFNFFKINFFSHTRAFHDGNFASLMTSTDLTEYYIAQKYPIRFSQGKGIYLEKGFHVESHLGDSSSQKMINDLQEKFNTAHFIYVVDKHKAFDDMYSFATTPENEQILNHYMNNIDLLKKFLFYYKDKSNILIKNSTLIKYNNDHFPTSHTINQNIIDHHACTNSMPLNKITITGHLGEALLSKRELDCLKLLTKSHSFKEIGKTLSLSPRTVETYVNNMKNKLGCDTKKQLIDLIFSMDMSYLY